MFIQRAIILLMLLLLPSLVFGEPPISKDQSKRYVQDVLLVKFKDAVKTKNPKDPKFLAKKVQHKKIIEKHGGREDKDYSDIGWKRIKVTPSRLNVIKKKLEGEATVQAVVLDEIWHTHLQDTAISANYEVDTTRMKKAFAITQGSSSVVVAVIDTGINTTLPLFTGGRVVAGYNPVLNNSNVHTTSAAENHGTMTSSVVLGVGMDNAGYGNIKVMPIKANTDGGSSFETSDVVEGIIWAKNHGAHVINMSLGSQPFSKEEMTYEDFGFSPYYDAIDDAVVAGVVVVASAGNIDSPYVTLPASIPSCIRVSATDSLNEPSRWKPLPSLSATAWGKSTDLAAPGTQVHVLNVDGTFKAVNGTSFSSPLTALEAALVKSQNMSLSALDVRAIMESTAMDFGVRGKDDRYGYGVINMYAAVMAAKATVPGETTLFTNVELGVANSNAITPPILVYDQVPIDVFVGSNVSTSKVELYSGATLLDTDTIAPFSLNYDTRRIPNAVYDLNVKITTVNGETDIPVSLKTYNIVTPNIPDIIDPPYGIPTDLSISYPVGDSRASAGSGTTLKIDEVIKKTYGASGAALQYSEPFYNYFSSYYDLLFEGGSPFKIKKLFKVFIRQTRNIRGANKAVRAGGSTSHVMHLGPVIPDDARPPAVTNFSVGTPQLLDVPVAITGSSSLSGDLKFLVTDTSNRPAGSLKGWSANPNTTFRAQKLGKVTLYPWAQDMYGLISDLKFSPKPIDVEIYGRPLEPQIRRVGNAQYLTCDDYLGECWTSYDLRLTTYLSADTLHSLPKTYSIYRDTDSNPWDTIPLVSTSNFEASSYVQSQGETDLTVYLSGFQLDTDYYYGIEVSNPAGTERSPVLYQRHTLNDLPEDGYVTVEGTTQISVSGDGSSATLTVPTAPGVVEYDFYSTSPVNTDGLVRVGTTTTPSYTFSGLLPDTQYSYQARGFDIHGFPIIAAGKMFFTPTPAPSFSLSTVLGTSKLKVVSLIGSDNALSFNYYLQKDQDPTKTQYLKTGSADIGTLIEGLDPNTTYRVGMTSVNPDGEGSIGAITTITTAGAAQYLETFPTDSTTFPYVGSAGTWTAVSGSAYTNITGGKLTLGGIAVTKILTIPLTLARSGTLTYQFTTGSGGYYSPGKVLFYVDDVLQYTLTPVPSIASPTDGTPISFDAGSHTFKFVYINDDPEVGGELALMNLIWN